MFRAGCSFGNSRSFSGLRIRQKTRLRNRFRATERIGRKKRHAFRAEHVFVLEMPAGNGYEFFMKAETNMPGNGKGGLIHGGEHDFSR